MKAASITVPSSHVPMLSHPKEVAALIEQRQRKSGVTEPMTAVKLEDARRVISAAEKKARKLAGP